MSFMAFGKINVAAFVLKKKIKSSEILEVCMVFVQLN